MKRRVEKDERLICVGSTHPKLGSETSELIIGSLHIATGDAFSANSISTRGPNTLYPDREVSWNREDFISHPDEIDRSKK